METNGLNAKMQSAYKSGHGTETTLLRVMNNIHMAIDGKKAVVLILFDLSAAFDTVDQVIMCHILDVMLG